MSNADVKAPDSLAVDAELSLSEQDNWQMFQLARERIRSLDAGSSTHMEQISVEDKCREPEDSSL